MARSSASPGPVKGAFSVFTTANPPVPVTGLTGAAFTLLTSNNLVDTSGVTVPTITEIGNGRYGYTVTLDAGYWHIAIRHATYNPRGWEDEFDVE